MEKLIILSDLWGKEKSDWVNYYSKLLENYFEVKFYDCCDLGDIDKSEYSENNLHQQFVNGGIERAVQTLIQKEKEIDNVIGFSVGGYIAWKAGLSGLKIKRLFAMSSTRLRYENKKSSGIIELYFGENDRFKPDIDWFHMLEIQENFYTNEGHDFYRKKEIVEDVCNKIIKQIKPSH
jgi:hypothetical protein